MPSAGVTRTLSWVVFNMVLFVGAEEKFEVNEGYNMLELPPTDGEPLLIESSINLRNILDVSETQQLISIETTLRFFWKDTRVKPVDKYLESSDTIGPYTTLNPKMADKFWMPDIFIDKAKDVRKPTYFTQPASLRVYNDSTLRYSASMNYDVACMMDFHRFPVDKQHCEIKFESFGHSSKQFQLKWKERSASNINQNISLAQFSFTVDLSDEYSTENYDISYPGLIMKIHLQREVGYHIVQTYIPSTVFVILAWISLFIQPESVPGRVAMGMTTLLTLTAMFSSVRQNVPRVSYVSMLDIWMVICILFVFIAIFEFIMVTSLIKNGRKRLSEKIERTCKVVIPVLFFVFNLVYWPSLMFG